MRLDQYTADVICRSMGLGAFEPIGQPAIRILLLPSFHPEVCITLSEADAPARGRLSVVALTQMCWRQEVPRRLPDVREEVSLPAAWIGEVTAAFEAARTSRVEQERRVCVDGMGVECCRLAADGVERFADHVYRPAVAAFIGRLVWEARVACRVPGVRNALADCGWYLGASYPHESDPHQSPARRVLVLGTPDDRADYLELLKSRGWGSA
ncbi:MAG: hypothetical protein U0871_06540 [Gemmataceae bacterium]